jgi:cell division protein FtsW
VKPSLAVISAWLLAQSRVERRMPGYFLCTLLVGGVLGLLILQPDLGMSIVVAAVWAATALEAFQNGSLFGRGPGEGTVKAQLPDAHTDFVMAVAGEEFGLIVCLLILALFAFVTLRALSRASKETSLFITLAGTGLGVQFGLQAAINMASTIQLIPAKGMTLPFISYGGSSALAMAICVGMMLSLTREHAGLREAV